MTELRNRYGRALRLAMIGGGPSSWIGRMHQTAAELDGYWRVVGGVFSSDPARSRAAGAALGFDPARSYGTVAELIEKERARPDGIDAVAIMTPNDTHYPYAAAALDAGLDVICDKPVTHDLAQARDLAARTRARGRLFAIAHGYSAYPMTRYAGTLARDGTLGALRLIQVEYIQNGLATRIEDGPQNNRLGWLLEPRRSGLALVMSAIGCHAQHLACFASGLQVARVCADVGALLPGRRVVDYVSALCEFETGVRGTFTVTQAAAGGENDIRLRVYGEKGMLDWSHASASYLRLQPQGEPVRVIGRGDPWLPPEIAATSRSPRGHPEGMRDAFANIYSELAQERMALSLGETPPVAPIPASRMASTRWRSSRRAWRRRKDEPGSMWPSRMDRKEQPMVQAIPAGYAGVTAYLIIRGAARALDYYKKAFGATELMRFPGENGTIGHAEIRIGDGVVMLADEMPGMGYSSPQALGGTAVSLMFYVPDVDARFAQAIAAGGTVKQALKDQFYGDRTGTLEDPFGHVWTIATHVEDVSAEEMQKRMAAM